MTSNVIVLDIDSLLLFYLLLIELLCANSSILNLLALKCGRIDKRFISLTHLLGLKIISSIYGCAPRQYWMLIIILEKVDILCLLVHSVLRIWASPWNTSISIHLHRGQCLFTLENWIHHKFIYLPIDKQMSSFILNILVLFNLLIVLISLQWVLLCLAISTVRVMSIIWAWIIWKIRVLKIYWSAYILGCWVVVAVVLMVIHYTFINVLIVLILNVLVHINIHIVTWHIILIHLIWLQILNLV